ARLTPPMEPAAPGKGNTTPVPARARPRHNVAVPHEPVARSVGILNLKSFHPPIVKNTSERECFRRKSLEGTRSHRSGQIESDPNTHPLTPPNAEAFSALLRR